MNSFNNMSPEEQERYKSTGEKYMGYDRERLDKKDAVLYSSTGKKINASEYTLTSIAESVRNGVEFSDLDDDDINALSLYYGENYKEKFYSDYNLED